MKRFGRPGHIKAGYLLAASSVLDAACLALLTDDAPSDATCRDRFRRFENDDFKLEDKERSGAPKKFEGKESEEVLDGDRSRTPAGLGNTLRVDESTVSKRLKVSG